jgi:uncharacterized protein YtpQ (UPF0354 family)
VIVPVTPTTPLPVLVGLGDPQVSTAALTDDFLGELAVAYAPGPPYGRHLLTREELDDFRLSRRELRRRAAENLYAALDRVGVHGQPPALMLSFDGFDGLESSVLLAQAFWDDLAGSVPGELVAGAPARDVVMFTGSQSPSGLRKVRRAVDRVIFAGGPHLLSQDLLVRRQRRWELLDPAVTFDPVTGEQPPVSPAMPPPRTPLSSGPAR